MDPTPPSGPEPPRATTAVRWRFNSTGKLPVVAALALLSMIIVFVRLHTYDEPLERDITIYAVIGHEMRAGRPLYSDLWDHKPPAIYLSYALAEVIAGYGRDSVFLLNVGGAVVAMLACYFAGSAAGGGRVGGLAAAAFWAITSGDVALQGNQPNTELFLNALLATGFALFVRRDMRSLGLRGAIAAGLIFALASLYKPVVVVEAGLLGLAYCIWPPVGSRKKAFGAITLVAAIGGAVWGLMFGYFLITGRSEVFRETIFTYNRYYSGNIWHNLSQWPIISPGASSILLILGALVPLGAIVGFIGVARRKWFFLVLFCIATHIAIVLPGRSFPHYFQLWLPPLCIGAAWSIMSIKTLLPDRFAGLSYAVAIFVCGILITIEIPYFLASPEVCSEVKYGSLLVETDRVSRQIGALILPNETFYEWGSESEFYFDNQRHPPSGIIFAYPLLRGPLAVKLSQRLISDLERTRPDLVVIRNAAAEASVGHPVMNWIESNYRPFAQTQLFLLCARKGSALDQRQRAVAVN